MTWRVAESLLVLRNQVNAKWPNRDKSADGTIGDAAHASRSSDHNPYIIDNGIGVVSAMDITNDPAKGPNSEALANALRISRDQRIKYIISNRKIAAGNLGPNAWQWRPYTGINPHNHHMHLSVKSDKADYDNTKPWVFDMPSQPSEQPTQQRVLPSLGVLKRGSTGQRVEAIQVMLNKHNLSVKEDGIFGPDTEEAVKVFQTKAGLIADGIVGPYTIEKLQEKP